MDPVLAKAQAALKDYFDSLNPEDREKGLAFQAELEREVAANNGDWVGVITKRIAVINIQLVEALSDVLGVYTAREINRIAGRKD